MKTIFLLDPYTIVGKEVSSPEVVGDFAELLRGLRAGGGGVPGDAAVPHAGQDVCIADMHV